MLNIELIKLITRKFPYLAGKLRKAKMSDSPEEFVNKTLVAAIYMSAAIVFIVFLFGMNSTDQLKLILICLGIFPFVSLVLFFYFFQVPVVRISKMNRDINKEIVFAGRFLIVEIESGVTLFTAMTNLPKNYPYSGVYFQEIVNKINIGTSIEDALTETIDLCPNEGLVKILWQISNSLNTGGDIAKPLRTVVENLIKEQQIQMNEYAKKLNPLAMFYMLIAIILPSLGVTMFTIISIFMGLKLNLVILMFMAGLNGFMQFMFVAILNSIRPPVEL